MPDPTEPTNGNGALPARREFQFLVGGALAICLALQGILMTRLMTGNPPDASWDLIKTMMSHLGQLDLLLVGGLLGMSRPHP
jgi:hypothetical protein